MAFNEADVSRDQGGKFDTKTGTPSAVELPTLSPGRAAVLEEVFDNEVKEFFPLSRKPGAKRIYKTSDHRTISRPALEWLMQNGYVRRASGPSLRGTPLAPTAAAQEAREQKLDALREAGKTKCAKCYSPSVLPSDYEPLCAKHYLASVDDAQAEARDQFKDRIAELAEAKGIPNPLA